MTVLTVGVNEQYSTVAAAIAATHDGDTVLVNAGTYVNDFATIGHKITLQSVGGLAILQATVSPPNGKAILTTDADAVIDGFGFTGASVGDNNGAGIRYQNGNLVVRNSVFWDNQDGILGNRVPDGTIVIDNSEFSHNGAGDGRSHNIYIGEIASVVVSNSYFHDVTQGHEIKSRAYSTTIINNRIFDNNGDGSYNIDIPDGGVAVIQGNIIEKGVNAPNYTSIHFGGENGPYANSSLTISGNTIVNDNASGFLLNNATSVQPTLSNNSIWGFAPDHIFQNGASPVVQSGTTVLAERPTLDLSTVAPVVVDHPAPVFTEVPPNSPYATFGVAGAVTATGHILTVGARGQFQTLAAALVAARDGDTIQVAAGAYRNDFGSVNAKVIIEGVGGIAHFVQSPSPGFFPMGVLTVNADATLKNLAFSGGHGGANSHEGGVAVTAGNVTIVNSKFDDNDIGILALSNPTSTVSVYGSEIGANGNYDKGTHNITIGSIASFTLKDSYVHDALTGHEISDHAYNTVIEGNRIIDGPNANASFLIGLGQGGNGIIRNNVLEKGLHAANGVLVLIGGEGAAYDNTKVQIDGNTLVSNMVYEDHPYTYFLNATGAAAGGLVTAADNTFVGGVPGSQQAVDIVATGSKVAASAVLDTASPVSAALAPAMTRSVKGPNTLSLTLGEVKGYVDSQFIVSVDGAVAGGGLVTASQDSGGQVFNFNGWWSAGEHTVTVTGTNLFSDKSAFDSIRSFGIVVDRVALDGRGFNPAATLDMWNTSYSVDLTGQTKLADFDAAYYLVHNPDVLAAGMDPLAHYMQYGWKEGRDPSALFSAKFYLARNPDVAAAGVNPLMHYEASGWREQRDPSTLFSVKAYLAAHPEVAAAKVDPLQSYLQSGEARLYTDPLIDPTYYHDTKSSVARNQLAAMDDYHNTGWQQGLNPSAWFNTNYYLRANPDVAAAGIDPLQHYETVGWTEGRSANPWFSTAAYTAAHPERVLPGINPLLSYLESPGAAASPSNSPYLMPEAAAFDPVYYLAHNPDVLAAHVDPLFHYEHWGWREGRDASASFDGDKYLAAYADVKAAGIDPLAHYVNNGVFEGRQAFAA